MTNSETIPRVLVVDDEKHIRLMIKTVVKGMGYSFCGEASNGREAIHLALETKPDLVLMDVNMPIKTGPESIEELIAANEEVCIIMLTSVADMATVEECLNAGASQYIRKDTPVAEMKILISQAWEAFLDE
jgi:two-component system, chemotaxis family, chemotaxis protein CheY